MLPSKEYKQYHVTHVTNVTLVSKFTNYSAANSLQTLRVHVAPVGFEIDRIVLPAIKMKADRVWLVAHNEPHVDKGDKFVKAIQSKLKDAGIECLQAKPTELIFLIY